MLSHTVLQLQSSKCDDISVHAGRLDAIRPPDRIPRLGSWERRRRRLDQGMCGMHSCAARPEIFAPRAFPVTAPIL